MTEKDEVKFRQLILPHFEAAFNLARWLTKSEVDASDVLQDASIKAFRYINTMKSEHPRAWFLQIVRNTSYTLLKSKKMYVEMDFENEIEDTNPNAEEILSEHTSALELHEALNELAVPYREILILRELEEMSYEEIAEMLQVPLGTVMSRLARGRELLRKKLILKGTKL